MVTNRKHSAFLNRILRISVIVLLVFVVDICLAQQVESLSLIHI